MVQSDSASPTLTSRMQPYASFICVRRAVSTSPRARAFRSSFSSIITSNTALPTAHANGLLANVWPAAAAVGRGVSHTPKKLVNSRQREREGGSRRRERCGEERAGKSRTQSGKTEKEVGVRVTGRGRQQAGKKCSPQQRCGGVAVGVREGLVHGRAWR